MRLRHLGEPGNAGDLADPRLVRGVTVAVHAHHRHRPESVGVGGPQVPGDPLGVERDDDLAVRADPLGRLDHPRVHHLGPDDLAREDRWPFLVADPQRVGEARRDDQDGGLARALQQGIRRDGGAEADHADPLGGNGLAGGDGQQMPDPGHGRIVVAAGVLGEQLVDGQRAIRTPGDHVGERATAVDPELPATVHGPPCAHAAVPCSAMAPVRQPPACRRGPLVTLRRSGAFRNTDVHARSPRSPRSGCGHPGEGSQRRGAVPSGRGTAPLTSEGAGHPGWPRQPGEDHAGLAEPGRLHRGEDDRTFDLRVTPGKGKAGHGGSAPDRDTAARRPQLPGA